MKAILVPIDFSESSYNALNYAAEIAKLTGAKLVLIHIYQIPIVQAEIPVVMPVWDNIEKDCLSALKKAENKIHHKHGKTINTEYVCRMGFSADEIIKQYIIEKNIDLVVMGMKGAGYLSEKLIGSVTTSLIKKSNCPILVINEQVKFKSLKKIVLAYDYEEIPDKSVLNPLKEFIKIFKSNVLVLNVVNENKKIPVFKEAIMDLAIEQNLKGINHSTHFIENEDTIDGINEFVAHNKADMIVIIPHKHTLLNSIFHESNTKQMAFHTSIPLLALHG